MEGMEEKRTEESAEVEIMRSSGSRQTPNITIGSHSVADTFNIHFIKAQTRPASQAFDIVARPFCCLSMESDVVRRAYWRMW